MKMAPTGTVAGTMITYTLSVTNAGPSDADDVLVADTLPPGLDQMGVISNLVGSVVSGGSTDIVIQANIDSALRSDLTNQASVTSSNLDPNIGDNTDSVISSVRAEIDLEVSTVGLPASVVAGTLLIYDFNILNQGPSDATGVVVTNLLPSGVTPLGPLSHVVGTLSPAASTNFSIPVMVDSGTTGSLTNEVMVSGVESDVDAGDNVDQTTITVLAEADVQVQSGGVPNPVVAGELLTYTVTVTNAGQSDAVNVMANVAWPLGVTPGGALATNLGTLVAGANTSMVFALSVDSGQVDPLTNTVSVVTSTTDPAAGNNADALVIGVNRESDLGISKTAPATVVAGTSISYTLSVTNAGPSDADDVAVLDQLPSGLDQVGIISNQVGSVVSGGSTNITILANVLSGTRGSLTNQASVMSSNPDPSAGNNVDSVETVVDAEVDLEIMTVGLPGSVVAGTGLMYDFSIVNQGPSDATSVMVTNLLPSGMTPVSILSASLGALEPLDSTNFSVSVTVDSDALGTLTNQVMVSSAENEADPNDNLDQSVIIVDTEADLQLGQSAQPNPVVAGTTLRYTLTVTNAGPSDARDVLIDDILPADGSPSGLITTNVGDVAAGASASVVLDMMVNSGAEGTLTNLATVSSVTPDPAPNNSFATSVVSVKSRIGSTIV